MKKECQPTELSEEETADHETRDSPEPDPTQGRSGEGAHSAMKHWLHEERQRIKRPEH